MLEFPPKLGPKTLFSSLYTFSSRWFLSWPWFHRSSICCYLRNLYIIYEPFSEFQSSLSNLPTWTSWMAFKLQKSKTAFIISPQTGLEFPSSENDFTVHPCLRAMNSGRHSWHVLSLSSDLYVSPVLQILWLLIDVYNHHPGSSHPRLIPGLLQEPENQFLTVATISSLTCSHHDSLAELLSHCCKIYITWNLPFLNE